MSRRIIVTGGATGLGKAIAHAFLAESPELVLIGRRQDRLDEAVAELNAANPEARVTAHSCDLRDPDAVQALADELRAGAEIDVLVLNAGGNFGRGGADLHQLARSWRDDFEGNVLTSVLITEALLGHIKTGGAGRIIAMSSVAGIRGSDSYGSAKGAINAWTWWMSGRLAADGITVNAVAPGFVPDTEFWYDRLAADPHLWESRVSGIPLGREGTPEEVAEAVLHFASPRAGWTSGQILGINGGAVLGR